MGQTEIRSARWEIAIWRQNGRFLVLPPGKPPVCNLSAEEVRPALAQVHTELGSICVGDFERQPDVAGLNWWIQHVWIPTRVPVSALS